MTTSPGNHDDADERRRTRQNILALALLLLLVLLGLWLFAELRAYLKIEACIEAGYRNCAPVEK